MVKPILVLIIFCLFGMYNINAQGCVAIRGNTTCSLHSTDSEDKIQGTLDLQINHRYFKSFRHFRGSVEEVHRIDEGTEVINHSHFTDLGLSYSITDRWAINLVIPFVNHRRSSMYEHGGNPPNGLGERHETSSFGLSDISIEAMYWLLKPGNKKFNYSLGLGLKLPTGSYDYKDTFYNQGEMKDQDILKVVDQSIQPGDGGLGVSFNLQGYHVISPKISWINSLYYMFNVQESNGVLTRNGSSEFSCPDQYSFRTGLDISLVNGFNFFIGSRIEGVPSNDIIGGSSGYRRPGYVISVEPGFGYQYNNLSIFCSLPVSIYRNRTQSYQDKVRTETTGIYKHGDAAFSDCVVNLNIFYRVGKSNMKKHYASANLLNSN